MADLQLQGAKATGENWRDNWQTPVSILDLVNNFFNYGGWVDPCPANPCVNGLDHYWKGSNAFINPPFSQYVKWADYSNKGAEHIWIMHTRNSTGWFKKILENASALCLLSKRVHFIDPRTGEESESTAYGMSQCLIYTGQRPNFFKEVFSPLGTVLFT